jgi:LysM repeat protein
MFGLFCPDSVLAEEIGTNSQNMALLQAVITPDPKASTTKDSSVIIASNSLAIETQVSPDSKIVDNDQISLYVVHQGDTLPAIAKMFGVSVNTIRWGNDIKGNSVSVGQTLVIMPISGIQHTVKSGDTLQSIAKQHKGDMDEILQYNNLVKNSKIAVGDVIFVPDGEAVSTPSTNTNPKTTKPSTSMPVYDGYYMRPIIGGVKTQGRLDVRKPGPRNFARLTKNLISLCHDHDEPSARRIVCKASHLTSNRPHLVVVGIAPPQG